MSDGISWLYLQHSLAQYSCDGIEFNNWSRNYALLMLIKSNNSWPSKFYVLLPYFCFISSVVSSKLSNIPYYNFIQYQCSTISTIHTCIKRKVCVILTLPCLVINVSILLDHFLPLIMCVTTDDGTLKLWLENFVCFFGPLRHQQNNRETQSQDRC